MNIKKILTIVIFMTTLIVNAQIKLTGVVKDSIVARIQDIYGGDKKANE